MRGPKMTRPRLEALIEQGRGIGTGDRYKPWIKLTRQGTSAVSNQSSVAMPCVRRHCCFLSQGERRLALVLWWIGAEDVREQFPLWPWQHPSPYCEVDDTRAWPDHPGMTEVARVAGIRLHTYPGLSIPAVLTIDLLVTLAPEDRKFASALLGISCKPQELYVQARPSDRLRERLELDRRYCQVAGIQHLLLHPEQLPSRLTRQLEWLAPMATTRKLSALRRSVAYQHFVDHLRRRVYEVPAYEAIQSASRRVGWDKAKGQCVARTATWFLDVDVDIAAEVAFHEPLRPGGLRLRQEIRQRIFQGALPCS